MSAACSAVTSTATSTFMGFVVFWPRMRKRGEGYSVDGASEYIKNSSSSFPGICAQRVYCHENRAFYVLASMCDIALWPLI